MTKFVELRTKSYSCLIDEGSKDKKGKITKRYVIKGTWKLENHKNYLEATKRKNKTNHWEKNQIDIDSIKSKRIHEKQ